MIEILTAHLIPGDVDNPFKDIAINYSWLTGKNAVAFGVAIGVIWGVVLIIAGVKLIPAQLHLKDAVKKNMAHEVETARKEWIGSLITFIAVGCVMVIISVLFIVINLVTNAAAGG